MTDLPAVIVDLVDLFDRLSLPYAIMGGIAVRAHAIPRPTYDVDFTLAAPPERLGELLAAIEARGYTVPDQYAGGWTDRVGGMPLVKIRLYLDGRGVDADIFLVETSFQRDVIERRVACEVEGRPMWIVSAEDLVLFKLIASRPRDLIDIQDVFFTQGTLDEPYLRRQAQALGIEARLDNVLAERE